MGFRDDTGFHLNTLSSACRRKAFNFIYALRTAGIPAYIGKAGGKRTLEEQQRLVGQGLSRTTNSKHLTGNAFDIDILGYGRDDIPKEIWENIGRAGEAMGLKWGGRFKGFYDAGHFEV